MSVQAVSSSEYMLGPELGAIIVDKYVGGVDEHGCYSGHGEARFRSGNTYRGEFSRGVMDGQGRYTWISDGTVYEGELRKNELLGMGRYTWSNGSTYEGGVAHGLRNGQGVFTSADGTLVYEGGWKESRRQGQGVQRYGVGTKEMSSYAGEWKDNCRSGRGTMSYASGNSYEGEWVQDRKEGQGTMIWRARRERYIGEWSKDLQCGYGEHVWMEDRPQCSVAMDTQKQMCNVYRGQWRAGMRHGKGTFFYADGSRHMGHWVNNRKHGAAVFVSDSGRTFEGTFDNDVMLGKLSQDDEHPELSAAIKLKISDLLSAGDDRSRAASVRDVERSALQLNSDLKLLYKHYAKPGATAPTDRTMFTMSMQQFISFARDCRALAPFTSVTVGEVYRIFFRMRRQHAWELSNSLKRAMAVAAGNDAGKLDNTSTEQGGAYAPYSEDDGKAMYDSGRAVMFREFVEGVVRLASAIGVQQGGSIGAGGEVAGSPPPSASASHSPSPFPVPALGGGNPRGISPAAAVLSPRAPHDTPDAEAPMEAGGSLLRGAATDDGTCTKLSPPTVNECFRLFVTSFMSRLCSKLAAESGAGGSAGGARGGAGRGGGRGEGRAAGGAAPRRDGENEPATLPGTTDLGGAEEQVIALYLLYSGPLHVPMTLRGLLRVFRDARLRERADLSPDEVKQVFKAVGASQYRISGEQVASASQSDDNPSFARSAHTPQCQASSTPLASGDSAHGSQEGGGLVNGAAERGAGALQPTLVGAHSLFASAVDLDLLDEELMVEDFKAVIMGIFHLLRCKASARGTQSPSPIDAPKVKASAVEPFGDKNNEGDGPDNGDVGDTPAGPDQMLDSIHCAKNASTACNVTAVEGAEAEKISAGEARRAESLSPGRGGGSESCQVPDWLVNQKVFVSEILAWAKEGRAEKKRLERLKKGCESGTGSNPAKRTMPQS